MREREVEFDSLRVKIVIISFEAGFFAAQYVRETNLRWPLLVDESRAAYQNYGMFHASFRDVWTPKTLWAYVREILKGTWPKKATGDIYQRGGDVLIDPNGIVRMHHVAEGPAARPGVDIILSHVRRD